MRNVLNLYNNFAGLSGNGSILYMLKKFDSVIKLEIVRVVGEEYLMIDTFLIPSLSH